MPDVGLPHIDTHTVIVAADVDRVWDVLVTSIERALSGRAARTYARVMHAEDRASTGPRPLAPGSTTPGFRVVRADRPSELVLTGRHRLAAYEMVFVVRPLGDGRTTLACTTNAEFAPGPGRAYRGLVIGSGGHTLATRRLLTTLRRRAER